MTAKDIAVRGAQALIFGITFKENCPDIRNTKVVDIYNELREYGVEVSIYDPWANVDQVYKEYGIRLLATQDTDFTFAESPTTRYDAIILAIAHDEFLTIDFNQIRKEQSVVFDTKGVLPRAWVDARL